MKICFCAARASITDAFRHRLESLNFELTGLVRAGESDCDFCLLLLPDELDDASSLIVEHRRLLTGGQPLIASGSWIDAESVTRLIAAGADDYIPSHVETQELSLRLHIFAQQCSQRSGSADRARWDAQMVRTQRLETLASLTGSVAHDYNNLISAIQGNAELALMDMTLDAPVRYSLEQINSAAHRAAEITRQILAFRGSGSASSRIQPLNLSQLIRDMSELLRVSVGRKCRIEYSLNKMLPLVAGDAIRVRQLVISLVADASKSLGRVGGLIQIRTSQGPVQSIPQVTLEVQFAASKLQTVSSAQTVRVTGEEVEADSALAAAQVIAREYATEVTWTATDLGGIHRVLLPTGNAQDADTDADTPFGEPVTSSGTILLIDDDEAVRVAAHRLLRRAGYTVFEASAGEEGLAVASQIAAALDAVLVDLNMPGLECRDLLLKLRRLRSDLRLVVWSGLPEEAAREEFAGVPDVAFIEKPAQLGELPGTLRRVLKS